MDQIDQGFDYRSLENRRVIRIQSKGTTPTARDRNYPIEGYPTFLQMGDLFSNQRPR